MHRKGVFEASKKKAEAETKMNVEVEPSWQLIKIKPDTDSTNTRELVNTWTEM